MRWLALSLLFFVDMAAAATLRSGGVDRHYELQAPAQVPAPLVLVLHGNTQRGEDMRTRTAWPAAAKREGFAVVFPDGLNRSWADARSADERAGGGPPAGTDDVAFLSELVEHLVVTGIADPKRIYVTGVSNGGAMTLTLACQRPALFAAAASVIMSFTEHMAAACTQPRPLPMLLMNGTADPLVNYSGGRGSARTAVSGLWSSEATLEFWRRVDGCKAGDAARTALPDRDPNDGSTATRIGSTCPSGMDVQLYRINGGGHRMPGTDSDVRAVRIVDRILGPQNRDIDGAETIWAFFKRFTRR